MFSLGIQSNIDQVAAAFDEMSQRQVPFATALALTRTAYVAKGKLVEHMGNVFDNPTPYTLNSLYVRAATKQNLIARVEHKDFAGKGTPASKYLRPEIEGGGRTQKRSEQLIAKACGVPGGYWVPANGAKVDAYGNVRGALIVQILSKVQLFRESGFFANATTASQKRALAAKQKRQDYFIMAVGNPRGLKPGIYARKGEGLIPILFVVPAVKYKPRYDMSGVVDKTVQDEFGQQFIRAMDDALATAKLTLRD